MSIEQVKDRIERVLRDYIGTLDVSSSGDFSFPFESVRVCVGVYESGATNVVQIWSVTNIGLQPTLELYEYLVTRRYLFGAPQIVDHDGAKAVMYTYSMLGDTLDPDELTTAVRFVARSANELDDEIKKKFGGERTTDA